MSATVLTQVIRVAAANPDALLLQPAAAALVRGELVAFPTETVYGLGGDALNPTAVARIFQVKGRPPDNPLIVHGADLAGLEPLVRTLSPLARLLLEKLSPGPLTLVLPRSRHVPDLVSAGLDTVAVRIPDHPVAHCLLRLAGIAVAAPSANRSGRPSPTQSWHVLQDLDGRIPYLVDGGPCRYGLESTVVDLSGPLPVILRPGSITRATIRQLTGIEPLSAADDLNACQADTALQPDRPPRARGMKYRHYAPRAQVHIFDLTSNLSQADGNTLSLQAVQNLVRKWLCEGRRIGLFASEKALVQLNLPCKPLEWQETGDPATGSAAAVSALCSSLAYGPQSDAAQAGRMLFDALRILDSLGCDLIIAEGLPDQGVGSAYMNRLRKAACPADRMSADEEEKP